jgi:ParB family chromosome partitioning protein
LVDDSSANLSVYFMAKPSLGRGLGALLGGTQANPPIAAPQARMEDGGEKVQQIGIGEIVPSPLQPRRVFAEDSLTELVDSIRARGIFQPLIVRHSPKGTGFELIAGERRWRAARKLNLLKVPVIVRTATDQQVLELALIENLQRAELDAVEEADGYATLIETFGLKQEEVAERVGKSRATVANALRLRALPGEVRDLLRSKQISVGHAKAILGLTEPAAQTAVAREVVKRGLSVRQAEALVRRQVSGTRGRKKSRGTHSADWRDLELRLQRATGTRARVVGHGERGQIELPYTSPEELERLSVHLGVRPGL